MQHWHPQQLFRHVIGAIVMAAMLFPIQVAAQNHSRADQTPSLPAMGSPERESRLREMYSALKSTQNLGIASNLERKIWAIWLHHGNPKIDELMAQALAARRESNYEKAIALTDQIIQLAPDYAEGWNQRATLHFLRESYDRSLRDVAETLRLEPNHFGALSGRAVIRMRQGKSALAIQNILEALKVNPHLQERRLLDALGYKELDT